MAFQAVVVLLAVLILQVGFSQAASCTTSTISKEPGTTKNYNICIDGKVQRTYLLFLPKNYAESTTAKSLIISYHGADRTAQNQLDLDKLTNTYFNKDAIVVYPQGLSNTWEGAPKVPPTDVDFTTHLIDTLKSSLNIDASKIYATGKSQGGGFVGVLACDATASKIFAAFAPVSGAFYTTVSAKDCKPESVKIDCNPGRKGIPFIEFHGGIDDTILYNGDTRKGVCLPSIPHYLTEWAVRNGLSSANSSAPYARDVTEYSFGNGLVRGYYDKVIGHDWPATTKNSDNDRNGHSPASYNASEIIIEFFNKYTLS